MLPRKNRLTKKTDFEKLKKYGKSFQAKSFALLVKQREGDLPPRFGFIVSKKISRKAVERNKVKRRLRNIVLESLDKVSNGYDFLILAKKNVLLSELETQKKEMTKVFSDANVLK